MKWLFILLAALLFSGCSSQLPGDAAERPQDAAEPEVILSEEDGENASAAHSPASEPAEDAAPQQPEKPQSDTDAPDTPAQPEEPEAPEPTQEEPTLTITFGDHVLSATFADNSSAEEFQALLAQGPLTIEMEDYGGFEKVGPLGTSLTRNDAQITTEPGDIILYQGNQITVYYGTNTWSFTRLARIDDPTDLQEKLGDGTVSITFSLD